MTAVFNEDVTTTALLASIKRRGMIPSTTETLSDADFLAIATEEMRTYVMPALLSVNEEYGVVPYTIDIHSGVETYSLPKQASAETVRIVYYVDSTTGALTPMNRVDPEHRQDVTNDAGLPQYMMRDDIFVIVPTPTTDFTIQVNIFHRPAQLVLTSACAVVSSVSLPVTVTTAATIPATFTVGQTVDFILNTPGFRSQLDDATLVTGTTGTTVKVEDSLVGWGIEANYYIALSGQSPVPQIPLEAHPLLAQRTTAKVLEALGSPTDMWKRAYEVTEEMKAALVNMIQPRTIGAQKYFVNRNGPGFNGARRLRWNQ